MGDAAAFEGHELVNCFEDVVVAALLWPEIELVLDPSASALLNDVACVAHPLEVD